MTKYNGNDDDDDDDDDDNHHLHCCWEPACPSWSSVFLTHNRLIIILFKTSCFWWSLQLWLIIFTTFSNVTTKNIFTFLSSVAKSSFAFLVFASRLQRQNLDFQANCWLQMYQVSVILSQFWFTLVNFLNFLNCYGVIVNILQPPVDIRLARDPEFHLTIFPLHYAAHSHVGNLSHRHHDKRNGYDDDHEDISHEN